MNFVKSNDHILVALENGYYIVDTGSPFSFSFCGMNSVVINGKTIHIKPNALKITSVAWNGRDSIVVTFKNLCYQII